MRGSWYGGCTRRSAWQLLSAATTTQTSSPRTASHDRRLDVSFIDASTAA